MSKQDFFDSRLDYKGDLTPVIERACKFFNLQQPLSWSLFMTGLTDYSMKVDTGKSGCWVVKIFSKETRVHEIIRYEKIIKSAIKGNINHPAIKTGRNNELIYLDKETGMYMSVAEYIPGTLLSEYSTIPTDILKKVVTEAVKVSRLNIHPPHRFDMWQVDNIEGLYDKTKHVLHDDVVKKIEQVINSYNRIVNTLPRGFVHGDMTRTNIIARSDHCGEVSLLDFGSSGVYPRIHELAILAVHFLADGVLSLRRCINIICDEFMEQGGVLSIFEITAMYPYAEAILATKYLCNVYEIDEEIETNEMVYWRNISIMYLMSEPDTANPASTNKMFCNYYTADMWRSIGAAKY